MRGRLTPTRALAIGALAGGAGLLASGLYIPAKAVLAQALLERAWHKTQAGETARPWPWADITPVAEIEIPRLHRREIVLEGASGSAMAFGPGHMPNTARIGTEGTAVVAAHRDTQFRYLGKLSKGDRIAAVTADGKRTQFRVVDARVVRANASGLDPKDSGPTGARLALVTCYPFSGVFHSPLRYVVIADRDDEPASYDERAARGLSQSPNARSTLPGVPPWRG
jgi:sortase A